MTEYLIPPTDKGLLEGVDPAIDEFPVAYAPALENMRVSGATWQVRLGTVLWQVLPGSGSVRFLDNLYQSSGARTRLAARGNGSAAVLYELKEGTDSGFVAASGGTGLGGTAQNLFQGVTLGDKFYLTDRQNALWRYTPTPVSGNHLQAVTQPAAPVAAPVATPRFYSRIEDWSAPSWSDSDATKFADVDDSTNNPPPDYGKSRKLEVLNTSAVGQTITKPTPAANLNSHTIGFYLKQDQFLTQVALQMGLVQATDFQSTFSDPNQNKNTWYPYFVPIGDLQTLNYLRFTCIAVSPGGSANVWVSALYLPGRLEGPYRWVYTYYDPVSQRESAPSPISNGGQAMDFSAVGTSFNNGTPRGAFAKTCALRFTASGDASVTQVRIYRSGGVPELTVDDNGTDLWLRVATVNQFATDCAGGESAGVSLVHLDATTGIVVGDWLVLDPGVVGKEEYVQVTGKTSSTVNVNNGAGPNGTTLYAHADEAVVQVAFLDNVANEQINLVQTLDVERNNAPAGARFVARSPEGRLWLFNWAGAPTGIAISNKPTPDRPFDYEVFPSGVDPLTRRSITQGFQVQYTGDISQDEEIMWGGFYRGHPYFLTRQALYVVRHQSQIDWSATSIQRLHKTGCIAGDTVTEVNGVLYWVADGPRVMAWDGDSPPVPLSDRTVNLRLNAAPQSLWQQWFGRAHTKVDGHYYQLYFTPAGQTLNTQRLDFNVSRAAWEPVVVYDNTSTPIAYQAAAVRGGNVDSPDLYQIDSTGKIDQAETGSTDRGSPILATFTSNKVPIRLTHPYWKDMQSTGYLHTIYMRQAGTTDTGLLTLQTGGGEYGITTRSYTLPLAGTGDVEIKTRADRDLKGRWFQVQVSGSFVNRPAFRDIEVYYIVDRLQRVLS